MWGRGDASIAIAGGIVYGAAARILQGKGEGDYQIFLGARPGFKYSGGRRFIFNRVYLCGVC